jgi:hypothetical protein
MRLDELQQQVGRGEYRVDAKAVAEAILRRLRAVRTSEGASKPPQAECS